MRDNKKVGVSLPNNSIDVNAFAERIKKLRKQKGYKNQQDFADAVHVSMDTIRNWEQGKNFPDISTIISLSNHFNCNVDYLLGRIEHKTYDITEISKLTGLSPDAVEHLLNLCKKYGNHDKNILRTTVSDIILNDALTYALHMYLRSPEQQHYITIKHDSDLSNILDEFSNGNRSYEVRATIVYYAKDHEKLLKKNNWVQKVKYEYIGEFPNGFPAWNFDEVDFESVDVSELEESLDCIVSEESKIEKISINGITINQTMLNQVLIRRVQDELDNTRKNNPIRLVPALVPLPLSELLDYHQKQANTEEDGK